MKTKKLLFVIACVLFFTQPVKIFASHLSGINLTYQYVGPNQYLLTLKFYRDCLGIAGPTSAAICYQSSTAGLSGNITLTAIPGTGMQCQPSPCVAGNGISTCSGGTNFGIEEYVLQGQVTLPQAAPDWIFSYSDCCRNGSITTLNNSSGQGIFIYAKLDNLNFPINSSPQFIAPPFAQYCLNVLSTYSFTCMDPDGDSLVYLLTDANDGGFGCPAGSINSVIYNPPFSGTNPVSSSTPIVFDSSNGNLTFTPDILQVAVIGMIVREYRNGTFIGEVMREDDIYVVNGVIYTNYMNGKVYIDNNNNQVYDAGDQSFQGSIIEAQPGPMFAASNYQGNYSLPCLFGTFTAGIPNIPLYYVATPIINTANFSLSFQTDSLNDFALSAPYNAQDLRVILTGNNHPRIGNNTSLHITYVNVGTAAITGSVSLVYDTNFVYANSNIAPDNITGNVLTWNFTNLASLASNDIVVNFNLPSSVASNTQLTSYAEILPFAGDSSLNDNVDTLHEIAAISCDPNEKTVEPQGYISSTQILNGLYLEYTVFFQNTGNAPAINIIIADTLDQNLNIPTFEVLSASHPYTWSIRGNGIIEFRFDNINLPDSNSNEPQSHGFIKYRIKPKSNLVSGSKMLNTAYIVFDSNAPIMTNSTSTTVINMTGVTLLAADVSDFLVYPNPANSLLNIEMNLKETTLLNIQLYNAMGALVKNLENSLQTGIYKKKINLNTYSKGLYFLKVTTYKGVTAVKVVIE